MTIETDLAWVAGIVDGEGCIYGHWTNRSKANGGNVCVEIRIQSTSMAMITKIVEICTALGIHVTFEDTRWRNKSTKPAHRVSIRRQAEVLRFLRAVRPYLIVKGAEADVAIEWYERWGDQRGINKPRATQDEKVAMFDRLRFLKKVA